MGMDLQGESGNQFRASIWTWHPLVTLCEEVMPEEDLKYWHYNDGKGFKTKKQINTLITRLKVWLEQHDTIEEIVLESRVRVNEQGALIAKGGKSAYSVDIAKVKEFIEFLENCGGSFQIW